MPDGAGVPVKPIGRFLAQLEALEAHLHPGARIAVVGAGPAGTELALALAHRLGDRARITLVCSEADPLPPHPNAPAPLLAPRWSRRMWRWCSASRPAGARPEAGSFGRELP